MNLPNYFLADLPPEATLSPAMITEACQTLKRNREHYLAQRSTEQLGESPGRSGGRLAETGQPLPQTRVGTPARRKPASPRATLAKGPGQFLPPVHTGKFSCVARYRNSATRSRARRVTSPRCRRKSVARLSGVGPELLVHIAAGNIPNPTLMSIVLGLLTRSAQFVKCASGSAFLPRLFAHSIYDADPKLGACLEIAEWRGGNADLETALFAEAIA